MQIVRDRDLVQWLKGAIAGSQEVVDGLVAKLTKDRENMGMLSSHMAWSQKALTAAGRGAVYQDYLTAVAKGLVRDTPTTDAEHLKFYEQVRTTILRELITKSGQASNQSTLETSNLIDRAQIEALSALAEAIDWVIMDYTDS